MNPEKQRIAIAKLGGWTKIERIWNDNYAHPNDYRDEWHGICPHTGTFKEIPDYLNSLDAIHESEKALFEGGRALSVASPELRRELYFSQLIKVCGDHPAMSATAAQRVEAFLKTLGLWEEE